MIDVPPGLPLLTALLPTAAAGILLHSLIAESLHQPLWVGVGFMLTGSYLFLTKNFFGFSKNPLNPKRNTAGNKIRARGQDLTYLKALLIGLAQAIALFPGISRSGLTIATAIFLGIPPKKAVSFSLFMAIPTILGAVVAEHFFMLQKTKAALSTPGAEGTQNIFLFPEAQSIPLAGFLVAFITGLMALKSLIYLVKTDKLFYFAFYLWPLGLLVIVYSLF